METNITSGVQAPTRHPLFKWILVVGIAIVANLFLNYALDAFYQRPLFETFCPSKQVNVPITTEKACTDVGGQWNSDPYRYIEATKPIPADAPKGYCNENFTCQKGFESADKLYQRNVFIVLVAAGTVFLVGSLFATAVEAVALGFSLAGILSFIIGTMRYWSSMDERLRVVVLGLALAALVWVGIKKFRD
ncbi:MAG: hypothetical protein HZB11_03405 [Candidatus Yonathbacteria bacterium]|nr:hypothetical protein [Candidatus Yonathbacteria bacterium]